MNGTRDAGALVMDGVMFSWRTHMGLKVVFAVLLTGLALAFALLLTQPASAQIGRNVTNVATVSYDRSGHIVSFETNGATFIIESARTPSTVEFFRFAPAAPNVIAPVNGSDYSPTGALPPLGLQPGDPSDPFVPVGPAITLGGLTVNLSQAVPLARATHFLPGELIFVRVVDAGQNGDPTRVETVVITLRTPNGDSVVLRLYESGPNTGEFFAYIPSTLAPTENNDASLTIHGGEQLTATYSDPFDTTEVSIDTALVDPFGRVFDSVTGELLSGVRVTIVEAASGAPAEVFGLDGVSAYPSSLLTGSVVTDASGLSYPLAPGQFVFPLMRPGDYRFIVEPPQGYVYPSSRSAAELQQLPNAPFEIIPGSYGAAFTVTALGPLNLDVPLDPAGDLTIVKRANVASAAIGDQVGYVIKVTNRNTRSVPVTLLDVLPRGLRLVPGSVRVNGAEPAGVDVGADGVSLRINAGALAAGADMEVTYLLAVSAGARLGPAVNRAVAINASGASMSNGAEAVVNIVEDLLRSRLTIIGRVSEDGCRKDDPWARSLAGGKGVAGVRVYLETGEYAVTDEDGLYHFEGVRPGTHVVQVDTATLPPGLVPMACEDNTRFAGSATSQFVDARGGSLWRADFHLERTHAPDVAEAQAGFDEGTEYLAYDEAWVQAASPAPRWAYPATDRTPASRTVNLGILHGRGETVTLTLNGAPVPALNFAGRVAPETGAAELSRWRGVDILPGENVFVATVTAADGTVVATLTERLWYVTRVARARLVADQSVLVADGRTRPVIAVRLEDEAGRAVYQGRSADIDVSAPYSFLREDSFAGAGINGLGRVGPELTAGADGIVRVELEPTLNAGRVRIAVRLDDGRAQQIDVWLEPEDRDWILVGLVEGGLGLSDPSKDSRDSVARTTEGRAAIFAKGVVKGDWLLTLALDTAKRRGNADAALFDGYIDPNAYYTLYGDRTWQQAEADSRYPLYVKLERRAVQLLFGDFDTGLVDTQLGRYARRLSGAKVDAEGRHVSVTAFAAETSQGFVRDEIAADGTSGPYRLSGAPLVRNSEIITIETRGRLRPDEIVGVRTLVRWVDYEIDYVSGEVIFRHPVDVSDISFNPNIIVASYETQGGDLRDLTVGGRVSVFTEDRRLEAGASVIREDAGATRGGEASELLAADVTARLNRTTELRAEFASSARDTVTGTERADAYLVEVERKSETLTVTGYIEEQEAGFGLGQQSSATIGVRRVGAELTARLGEPDKGVRRSDSFLDAAAYTERALRTDASRDVVEATIRTDGEQAGVAVGVKSVSERYGAGGERRESLLATGVVRRTLADRGLTVTLSREQPIGERDEATLFPERTLLGADQRLTEWATLNLRHEQTNGADASGHNTLAGLTLLPWKGGELRLSADQLTQDSGRRLSATLGADQTVPLNEAWTLSFGAARRARIDGGDDVADVTPDLPRSPFEDATRSDLAGEEGFFSFYAGAGYRAERAAGTVRIEQRDGVSGDRFTAVAGAAREANAQLSYGAAVRAETQTRDGVPGSAERLDARVGLAWRPREEGLAVLARLDAKIDSDPVLGESQKLVTNMAANARLSPRTQASVNLGLKYRETEFAGIATEGWTQLVGTELRHDITPKLDLGFHASVLADSPTGTADFAFGPSIGLTPVEDVWLSAGYNIAGFHDSDFDGAEYSREGAYIKLRIKFDAQTARGLLNFLSPG